MILFLVALLMLFGASIVLYLLLRTGIFAPEGADLPELGTLDLPVVLWFSTFVILVSSATLHYAGFSVALERQKAFRRAMLATCMLGWLFLIIQLPALTAMIASQGELFAYDDPDTGQRGIRLYYFLVILVVLHGLHVLGGLVPLTVLTRNAFRGKYDHEHNHPIALFAMYWHFLDVIWIVMFSVFQFLG
jgi:heme/copper-type cytochrome/quinol oxidase subunit 3